LFCFGFLLFIHSFIYLGFFLWCGEVFLGFGRITVIFFKFSVIAENLWRSCWIGFAEELTTSSSRYGHE
jgi:hypothetical protein